MDILILIGITLTALYIWYKMVHHINESSVTEPIKAYSEVTLEQLLPLSSRIVRSINNILNLERPPFWEVHSIESLIDSNIELYADVTVSRDMNHNPIFSVVVDDLPPSHEINIMLDKLVEDQLELLKAQENK